MKKQQIEKIVWIVIITFLTACGQQAAALPPETPIPAVASPTFIPTSTSIITTIIPSPLPTQPIIPVITPDPIQVERWKEYEAALAKSFSFLPSELALCEWDILGQSDQEVYVWAICEGLEGGGVSSPALIHLDANGSIQNVEVPGRGSDYSSDILEMFPLGVREKFDHYHFGGAKILSDHLEWRQEHPDEPPLIVLSATPTP